MQIVDADQFTREYLTARGTHLAPSQPSPVRPIEQALAAKSKPSGEWWGEWEWDGHGYHNKACRARPPVPLRPEPSCPTPPQA